MITIDFNDGNLSNFVFQGTIAINGVFKKKKATTCTIIIEFVYQFTIEINVFNDFSQIQVPWYSG